MEKKNIIRKKEQETGEKKVDKKKNNEKKNLSDDPYFLKPYYMGPDGYLHCKGCRRRYELGHNCGIEVL